MPNQLNRRAFLTASSSFFALPVIAQFSGCGGDKQPEPANRTFTDPKFELLDVALQHEFGAVVQYGNHAGIIAALGRDSNGSIGTTIMEIIGEEVHHAILLTEILKKNGVKPTIATWPPQIADTADEMLQKDIAAESGAVILYEQILTLDFDDKTKTSIENIKLSEKNHHTMFSELLYAIS